MPREEEYKRRKILANLRKQYPEKSEDELEQMSWAILNSQRKGFKRGR